MKKRILMIGFIFLLILFPFIKEKTFNSDAYTMEEIRDKNKLYGEGISIAILDTGLDVKNEKIKIKKGKNFTSESNSFQDYDGHGTFIASLIASEELGLTPNADVYVGKVLESSREGNYTDISKGVEWATEEKVDIILMSLGGKEHSKELENAIKKAQKKGILIISAVGNDGLSIKDTVSYPANFNGVLGVGSINEDNKRWFKSSRGKNIDIMAQGQNIKGFGLNGNILNSDGTSVAAARVAGFVVLMKQHDLNLSPDDITEAIVKTATPKNDKFLYGNGILEPEKAFHYNSNFIFEYCIYLTCILILFYLYRIKGSVNNFV